MQTPVLLPMGDPPAPPVDRPGRRATWCLGALLLAYAVLAGRLAQLQVAEHEPFRETSDRQSASSLRWSDCRGAILDARGRPLAVSVPAWSCAIDPQALRDGGAEPGAAADGLAKALRLSPAEVDRLRRGLDRPGARFVWVRRRLSEEEFSAVASLRLTRDLAACALDPVRARTVGAEGSIGRVAERLRLSGRERKALAAALAGNDPVWIRRSLAEVDRLAIKKERIPGIYIPKGKGAIPGLLLQREYRREYPQGPLAVHAIGFSDIDGHGLEGVENTCDTFLRSVPAEREARRDALRRPLVSDGSPADPERRGQAVELTIDAAVQMICEEELARAVAEYKPVGATALVMDPRTGDLLAMATWPTYDPNEAERVPTSRRLNAAVATVHEPGSTFKPFVWARALETGKIRLETLFDCENGAWAMGGRTLRDAHGIGTVTAETVLIKSSNIGMAKIAALSGPRDLYETVRAYGFGEKTGLPLTGELDATVHPLARWTSFSMGSVPMGQELTVTPLQLATAYCALANGGLLPRPRLVRAVLDADGRPVQEVPVEMRRRVLRADTAATLRGVLRKVVTEGTGKAAMIPEYEIAGKTGTAQLRANEEERRAGIKGYSSTRYVSGFCGFAPAADPRIVVEVSVREPQGAHYGGTVAAPVVREVVRRTLLYLGVPPQQAAPEGAAQPRGAHAAE